MADVLWFYARGPHEQLRRWPLGPGRWLVGRGQPAQGKLAIPWDGALSRSHFHLLCDGSKVVIERCLETPNPIFLEGEARDRFELDPGHYFVVGQSRFQLVAKPMEDGPEPAHEFTLAEGVRQRLREQQAQQCLTALTRLLPDLKKAATLEQLWKAALNLLDSILPQATTVYVLKVEQHWDYTIEEAIGPRSYAPSRKLLGLCFEQGESAIHQWSVEGEQDMTLVAGVHWALAVPLVVAPDERYALYSLGSDSGPANQQVKVLVDLVGEALGHHLVAQRAERTRSQVGQFFSPKLRGLIGRHGLSRLLEPIRQQVTVMFFDLRGFSRATEQAEEQALETVLRYHNLLTEVMSLVTRAVFDYDGLVLDYAGDAVMAGWGAPEPQPRQAELAVQAAQAIVERVSQLELPFQGEAGLSCGIGLSSGEVVAGQVGGHEHFKYGWIGRVVNQAARLEGLTKQFGLPILVTGDLRSQLPGAEGLRRLGRVRPAGMNEPIEVFEAGCSLSAAEIEAYQKAEAAFAEGAMLEAIKHLREVPVEDPAGRFLARLAYRYEHQAPTPWDGVIAFESK